MNLASIRVGRREVRLYRGVEAVPTDNWYVPGKRFLGITYYRWSADGVRRHDWTLWRWSNA